MIKLTLPFTYHLSTQGEPCVCIFSIFDVKFLVYPRVMLYLHTAEGVTLSRCHWHGMLSLSVSLGDFTHLGSASN